MRKVSIYYLSHRNNVGQTNRIKTGKKYRKEKRVTLENSWVFYHEQVIATSEFSNNRESSILLFKIHALFFLTEPVVCKSPAVTRMTKHGIMGKTAPSSF